MSVVLSYDFLMHLNMSTAQGHCTVQLGPISINTGVVKEIIDKPGPVSYGLDSNYLGYI